MKKDHHLFETCEGLSQVIKGQTGDAYGIIKRHSIAKPFALPPRLRIAFKYLSLPKSSSFIAC